MAVGAAMKTRSGDAELKQAVLETTECITELVRLMRALNQPLPRSIEVQLEEILSKAMRAHRRALYA